MKKNILRCAVMALFCTIEMVILSNYRKIFIDYKTGGKFNISDNKVLNRTLQYFTDKFIKSKDNDKYNYFIQKLLFSSFYSYSDQKFVEDMFEAGGFSKEDLKKLRQNILIDSCIGELLDSVYTK